MGPALNTASSMDAYILADRGTWLAFKNRGDLDDPRRRRQAAVQPVRRDARQSGEASEREDAPTARRSSTGWCRPKGQKAIAEYKIGGEQLFYPNAEQPGA